MLVFALTVALSAGRGRPAAPASKLPGRRPRHGTHPARAADSNGTVTPPFRVAVCFWGMNRSLKYTSSSIRDMIFAPLEAAGARVDAYFHTYSVHGRRRRDQVFGERHHAEAHEHTAFEELRTYRRLDAGTPTGAGRIVAWEATSQTLLDAQIKWGPLDRLNQGARGTPWHYSEAATYRNVVHATYSLREVSLLWMATAGAAAGYRSTSRGVDGLVRAATRSQYYSYVVYARPDMRYKSPIDVDALRGLGPHEFLTPGWACWLGGLNDRFAAGRPAPVAAAFGMRFDVLRNLTRREPGTWTAGLHSENVLRAAVEITGAQPVFSARPCALRIRGDGTDPDPGDCEPKRYVARRECPKGKYRWVGGE